MRLASLITACIDSKSDRGRGQCGSGNDEAAFRSCAYGGGAVDMGKLAKDAGLNLMLGLFLFDNNPDWIEGNYQQFVKPAVARGNITAILIGNEDPQMIDTITQYLQKAKADLP